MPAKNPSKLDMSDSDFEDFDPIFRKDKGAHPLGYHFLIDELTFIIETSLK